MKKNNVKEELFYDSNGNAITALLKDQFIDNVHCQEPSNLDVDVTESDDDNDITPLKLSATRGRKLKIERLLNKAPGKRGRPRKVKNDSLPETMIAPNSEEAQELKADDQTDDQSSVNTIELLDESDEFFIARPVNDFMIIGKAMPDCKKLFDHFWLEKTITIAFSETGLGKSALMLQILFSIASGIPIPGFAMEVLAQVVLLIDTEFSTKWFQMRYTNAKGESFKFPKNLIRAEINFAAKNHSNFSTIHDYIISQIEKLVIATGTKVVVIDNITTLWPGYQYPNNAAQLMEKLKDLRIRYDLSILIVAHSQKRKSGQAIELKDLCGSTNLSVNADNVFSIGKSVNDESLRYLKQHKPRHGELIYGADNVAICRIEKKDNFLGFELVDYGTEESLLQKPNRSVVKDERNQKIIDLDAQGLSSRQIEAILGISHMTVLRVLKEYKALLNNLNSGNNDGPEDPDEPPDGDPPDGSDTPPDNSPNNSGGTLFLEQNTKESNAQCDSELTILSVENVQLSSTNNCSTIEETNIPLNVPVENVPQKHNHISIKNIDCIHSGFEPESVDLLICDPPFGIGEGAFNVTLNRKAKDVIEGYVEAPEDYDSFTYNWMKEAFKVLKPDGSMFIVSGWSKSNVIHNNINKLGFHLINKIVWKFGFGQYTKNKFTSSHYDIYFVCKDINQFKFNRSCRFDCMEVGINGKGKKYNKLYQDMCDVWEINREKRPSGPSNINKLPEELVLKMMLYASNEGDVVGDFFMGNFTTAVVAKKNCRKVVGCELNPNAFREGMKKLDKITWGQDIVLNRPKDDKDPVNQGKALSDQDKQEIKLKYNEYRETGLKRKDAIIQLGADYGRGITSIKNIINRTVLNDSPVVNQSATITNTTRNIYFQSDKGILYNGDSLEILKSLKDESVDLIITSPPYNLHKSHNNGKNTGCYQDDIPESRYQKNQIKVLNECFRILKPGGSMIYNHKNRIFNGVLLTPYEWLLKTKFILKQEIVWDNGGLNGDNIRFYPSSERIYWLVKDPKVKLVNVHDLRDIVTRKHWTPVSDKEVHTRVFPFQLPSDIIDCFPSSKVILDPYMGSGTVAIAAQKSNKQWIGIEKLKKFCKLTVQNCGSIGQTPQILPIDRIVPIQRIKKNVA